MSATLAAVRRLIKIAAGLGLAWLALQAAAQPLPQPAEGAPARPPDAPARPPDAPAAPAVGPAYDDDAAMAPHADPVASYTLQVSLDPGRHTLSGHGTIVWRNASRVPQRELFVHLYLNAFKDDRTWFMRPGNGGDTFRGTTGSGAHGRIDVKRFALAGADLWPGADKTSPGDPDDATDIRVPLPTPVEPGETLRFDVEWEAQLPSILLRTGYHDDFHMVAQWFPKIARLEPDGRWASFRFHRLSEFYADFGGYDVTVDTPEDVVVGATGRSEGEVRAAGRVRRRFVQEDVHDFAFAAWSKFHELTALTEDGVALRVLYPPGHERAAQVELDAVRFGLSYFGKSFGRYPYRTLTVVHPPAGAEEAGGMEYPTLITTGGPWFFPWTGVRFAELVTIHELGHQWFYGLVATDEHRWPFLDEGVNSYAEALAMEAWFPGSSAVQSAGLSIGLPATNRAASADVAQNAPVAQASPAFVSGADYGALVYRRTATILSTLGKVYGEDLVRRAVGRYARRYRFEHPGPDDLVGVVREAAGDDAADQLRVALFDRGTVDYSVAELSSTPEGDGYRGDVLVRRRGALRFPVDVDLVAEDGAVQRVRWDARELAKRIPYRGKSRLVAAVIDPEHRVLLDDDLGNNARRVSPARLSGGLLDRIAFGAEAALWGILP
jgi:hypothetical protein